MLTIVITAACLGCWVAVAVAMVVVMLREGRGCHRLLGGRRLVGRTVRLTTHEAMVDVVPAELLDGRIGC